ncbi:NAD-dependent epimerase/dehydratase family protein [Rickettsiales endosymbiont of Stachyamoeba lipophora]|uniref:NAD-dependent epimerase/dehydratase family protein n=1 Tax=Rickettsiales endosymbiont of Stachyamoeba lipophora TaxID=2486578 RepID=UPI000F65065A|nr:NAD-dependent epimerase/dehydratase family protein [Rickettsiales endosymbiont of Stachyamoeba lipophora]AZL15489.1 NAD-dependent epimerase/dehydratase family protein [Rickettsiales endosymbiont of Stachyamoeba lipophora]
MNFYKGKSVLVTGGTGLIGRPLVKMLIDAGAHVTVASLDDASRIPLGAKFVYTDLREFSNCMAACTDKEIVFHLAGVKGSPAMTAQRPASFFVPTMSFNINMMEAARRQGAERYLFTSSVGVYAPAEVFYENSVWSTFPSPNDRFAGWAKRMGELQAESYKIEYDWDKISIVRPANVYGPYDNFDPNNAMVIPSLIHRVMSGEAPLTVWGDGSPIRDFIFADDVARGMMLAVEKGINEPINLGSGSGATIKEVAEIVCKYAPHGPVELKFDPTKPKGDAKRIMDMERANKYGFECKTSLEEGIKRTIDWYINFKDEAGKRYNAFTEEVHLPPAKELA